MTKKWLIILFLIVCISPELSKASEIGPAPPKLPGEINIYFSEAPSMNKQAEIIMEFVPEKNLEGITANLLLSRKQSHLDEYVPPLNNFETINESTEWRGSVKKGDKIILKKTVVAKEIGYYHISGMAFADYKSGNFGALQKDLYLTMTDSNGFVSYDMPKNYWDECRTSDSVNIKDTSSFDYEIIFTSKPELHKPTGIIMNIKPKEDIDGMSIGMAIPNGVKLFDVKSSKPPSRYSDSNKPEIDVAQGCFIYWTGPILENESFQLKASIYFEQPGWGYFSFFAAKEKGLEIHANITVDELFSTTGSIPVCVTKECKDFDQQLNSQFNKGGYQFYEQDYKTLQKRSFLGKISDFFKSLILAIF